jgi:glycosyltransferase involved in cell wall biosynthesis
MKEKFGYLPQNERKKILLICDDIRLHSGIATVAREVVINTSQHFNWVNIGGALNHPDAGKRFDISPDTNTQAGITDASVFLYPANGYGDPDLIRQLIKIEKPDALFLITDPRYFIHIFQMETEIRKQIPIIYLNIWDDYPAPLYNKPYYEACDALLAISKQTKNINEIVLDDKAGDKIIDYVPHGLNENIFKPITPESESYNEFVEFKKNLFSGKEIDFTLFFNSRNIRRKQIPDTMLAYKYFIDQLPEDKAKKCAFVLHTHVVDDNGTDLEAVRELLFGSDEKYNIYFSQYPLNPYQMNMLYNISDTQILLTSNEGWGLSLTEAILAGKPIIANVTGGMQDQMRFEDEDGNWIDFTPDFPSNHNGTIKKHGEWAFPVYPNNRSLVGSPPTPYIWDDRCRPEDAAEQIMNVYNLSKEERSARGLKGREWALSDEAGLTAEKMGNRVINTLDHLFDIWVPKDNYELINVNEYKERVLNHKLLY